MGVPEAGGPEERRGLLGAIVTLEDGSPKGRDALVMLIVTLISAVPKGPCPVPVTRSAAQQGNY